MPSSVDIFDILIDFPEGFMNAGRDDAQPQEREALVVSEGAQCAPFTGPEFTDESGHIGHAFAKGMLKGIHIR